MVNIITVHSARPGTGKSTLVANIAVLLAAQGQRVGILDANAPLQSMPLFFKLPPDRRTFTFYDYLFGVCDSRQATYDVTPGLDDVRRLNPAIATVGQVFIIPISKESDDLISVLHKDYSTDLLIDSLYEIANQLELDILLIDTAAGFHDDLLLSLLTIVVAHTLMIVLYPDQRDYQGTGVIVEIARMLGVPRVALVVNQMAAAVDQADARQQLEQIYRCKVIALLRYTDELAITGSNDIFVLKYPDHPLTRMLAQLTATLGGQYIENVIHPES